MPSPSASRTQTPDEPASADDSQSVLYSLGASAARLQEFHGRYSARLVPRPEPGASEAGGERVLGRIDDYPHWRAWFAKRLQEQGADPVLRDVLPGLARGAAGAAFHGLIRTGHAVRARHLGELASALAYWAARHQALPACRDARLDLRGWLGALAGVARRHTGTWPPRKLIAEEIVDRAAASGFAEVANALEASSVREVARVAAWFYARTRNFTVLHVITASQAASLLAPWMSLADRQPFVPALAGGLLASGVLDNASLDPWASPQPCSAALPAWRALAQRAMEQDDEHVIKIVAACFALDQVQPDRVWRAAAVTALGLDPGAEFEDADAIRPGAGG